MKKEERKNEKKEKNAFRFLSASLPFHTQRTVKTCVFLLIFGTLWREVAVLGGRFGSFSKSAREKRRFALFFDDVF